MATKGEKTSNFKKGGGGKRTYASAINDELDVRKKAALTPPESGKVDKDGNFTGGEAPGEGTIYLDPKLVEVREEENNA